MNKFADPAANRAIAMLEERNRQLDERVQHLRQALILVMFKHGKSMDNWTPDEILIRELDLMLEKD